VGIFQTLKHVMTGKVIQQVDTSANAGWTTMSLRLKRQNESDDPYVVLAIVATGNKQYVAFENSEFEEFAEAVATINRSLRQIP
jgi:hypothetical protein